MREDAKVFGIGFHKTGTSSLAAALRILGYRVIGHLRVMGYFGAKDPRACRSALRRACRIVARFDAVQDEPWFVLYKELDTRFPGSKFILTTRSPDPWIGSVVRHFGNRSSAARRWIYGVGYPKGNELTYLSRYRQHNQEVVDYFRERPRDLLLLDITAGEGWEKLCPFLGVTVPAIPFPRVNVASSGEKRPWFRMRWWIRLGIELLPRQVSKPTLAAVVRLFPGNATSERTATRRPPS